MASTGNILSSEERREAQRVYQAEWYQENKERVRQQKKRWKEENRERYLESERQRYWKDPAKHSKAVVDSRLRGILGRMGMSWETYVELLARGCAACGAPDSGNGRRLHVDHDHKTGKFRGLLCASCNTALGLLEDSHIRIDQIAKYLRDHEDRDREEE